MRPGRRQVEQFATSGPASGGPELCAAAATMGNYSRMEKGSSTAIEGKFQLNVGLIVRGGT